MKIQLHKESVGHCASCGTAARYARGKMIGILIGDWHVRVCTRCARALHGMLEPYGEHRVQNARQAPKAVGEMTDEEWKSYGIEATEAGLARIKEEKDDADVTASA